MNCLKAIGTIGLSFYVVFVYFSSSFVCMCRRILVASSLQSTCEDLLEASDSCFEFLVFNHTAAPSFGGGSKQVTES